MRSDLQCWSGVAIFPLPYICSCWRTILSTEGNIPLSTVIGFTPLSSVTRTRYSNARNSRAVSGQARDWTCVVRFNAVASRHALTSWWTPSVNDPRTSSPKRHSHKLSPRIFHPLTRYPSSAVHGNHCLPVLPATFFERHGVDLYWCVQIVQVSAWIHLGDIYDQVWDKRLTTLNFCSILLDSPQFPTFANHFDSGPFDIAFLDIYDKIYFVSGSVTHDIQ